MEEPLTLSHLLSGRRILSLPDNTSEDPMDPDYETEVSTNDLDKRFRHLSHVMNHLWQRWRNEYLLELRNAHRRHQTSDGGSTVSIGDIVLVHDEGHLRGFWRIGRVQRLIKGTESDGKTRGAVVRVRSKKRRTGTLNRPLQLLYPLEINCNTSEVNNELSPELESDTEMTNEPIRPRRQAAIAGERLMKNWIQELKDP